MSHTLLVVSHGHPPSLRVVRMCLCLASALSGQLRLGGRVSAAAPQAAFAPVMTLNPLAPVASEWVLRKQTIGCIPICR